MAHWRQALHLEPPQGCSTTPTGCAFSGTIPRLFPVRPAGGGGFRPQGLGPLAERRPAALDLRGHAAAARHTLGPERGLFGLRGALWRHAAALLHRQREAPRPLRLHPRGPGINTCWWRPRRPADGPQGAADGKWGLSGGLLPPCAGPQGLAGGWAFGRCCWAPAVLRTPGGRCSTTAPTAGPGPWPGCWNFPPPSAICGSAPDTFTVGGRRWLGVCPQGLPHGETENQNQYQSGWFALAGDLETGTISGFTEWDKGFDFYAPQTLGSPRRPGAARGLDGHARRRLPQPHRRPGLAALSDAAPGLEADGGGLRQRPLRELDALAEGTPFALNGETRTVPLPFRLRMAAGGRLHADAGGRADLYPPGRRRAAGTAPLQTTPWAAGVQYAGPGGRAAR